MLEGRLQRENQRVSDHLDLAEFAVALVDLVLVIGPGKGKP